MWLPVSLAMLSERGVITILTGGEEEKEGTKEMKLARRRLSQKQWGCCSVCCATLFRVLAIARRCVGHIAGSRLRAR